MPLAAMRGGWKGKGDKGKTEHRALLQGHAPSTPAPDAGGKAGMHNHEGKLARWTGLEPATPGVTGRYSNQLSYHRALEGQIVGRRGGVKRETNAMRERK